MRQLLVGLIAAAGCKNDPQPPPPPETKPEPAPVPVKMGPATGKGSCTLNATGAITATGESPGGTSAVASKYWMSDAERGASPQAGLVLNCSSKDLRVSIVSKPDANVPFGPKTYPIDGKKGDLLIIGRAGTVSLVSFSGTVDVTAFDGTHLAGTIALSGARPQGGTVKIDGHFDYACPGYGNCAR